MGTKPSRLVIFLGVHLLTVCSLQFDSSSLDGRFFVISPGSELLKNTSSLKLLLKPFQGFVNGFVLFNVNYNHFYDRIYL